MRIAEEQVCAHATELFERKQSELIQPVVDESTALRLGREYRDEAHQIAWKTWPQPGRDFSCGLRNRLLDAKRVGLYRTLDVQPLQHRGNHFHVLSARAANFDFTLRNRGHDCPTSRFDVVAPQTMLSAAQCLPAL